MFQARWTVLIYFVLVILLAWFPWNFWLIVIGAVYARRLKRWNGPGLFARDEHQ